MGLVCDLRGLEVLLHPFGFLAVANLFCTAVKKKKKNAHKDNFFKLSFLDLSHSHLPVCFRLKGVRKINIKPFGLYNIRFFNSFFNLVLKLFLGLRAL